MTQYKIIQKLSVCRGISRGDKRRESNFVKQVTTPRGFSPALIMRANVFYHRATRIQR
ncbi:hypothetical protein PUN28_009217 [Cardiocondyla obscurior]|uniref:Ribosomal protein S16 n=1 Tax=Cardiocondyla obscurior TaxID=286306 RepID=A0AAW2FR10_9HYME